MKVKNSGMNNFIVNINNKEVFIEPDMVIDILEKDWEYLKEYPQLQSESSFFKKDNNKKLITNPSNVQSKQNNSSGS